MKIVPYECEYNGDCYQPQESPLTERPESRLERAKVASNHQKNDLNMKKLKTDEKMSSKTVLEILKKSTNPWKIVWKTAKNKLTNS